MKQGSEKLHLDQLIAQLQHLQNTAMPSALPVEIVLNGVLLEIEKIEFFGGSLGLFATPMTEDEICEIYAKL